MEKNKLIFLFVLVLILLGLTLFIYFEILKKNSSGPPDVTPTLNTKWPNANGLFFASGDKHNTSQFRLKDNNKFIIRRGFDFTIMTADKSVDMRNFIVDFEPDLGGKPEVKLVAAYPNHIILTTSEKCDIGKGNLVLKLATTEVKIPTYVLFNPFNPKDDVYINTKDQEEYVLNELGYAFTAGGKNKYYANPWHINQFDEESFNAAFNVIDALGYYNYPDVRFVETVDFSSPVDVSRFFSWLVNAEVLAGNWDSTIPAIDDESSCKKGVPNGSDDSCYSANGDPRHSPGFWTGSTQILKLYNKNFEKDPKANNRVEYGQCWVFGGVLNTLMRTLGIPSRQVSNFSSAHPDCPTQNMGFDKPSEICEFTSANFTGIMFEKENPGDFYNGMIWNFHSWIDVWMKRPDLCCKEYDGWQALDATPQEQSRGVRRMGPAPLAAVKSLKNISYDTSFVIAEVNYKIQKFKDESDTPLSPGDADIITTTPIFDLPEKDKKYSADIDDLTDVYRSVSKDYQPTKPESALKVFMSTAPSDRPDSVFIKSSAEMLGGNITISAMIYSQVQGAVKYTVEGIKTVYTSAPIGEPFMKVQDQMMATAMTNQTLNYNIDSSSLNLSETNSLRFSIVAMMPSGKRVSSYTTITINPPPVKIDMENCCTISKNQTKEVTYSYMNPYKNRPLTGVRMDIHSPHLEDDETINIGSLGPSGMFSIKRRISMRGLPEHFDLNSLFISAVVSCSEIHIPSKGYLTVQVV